MRNNPQMDEALAELEQLVEEIQVKLHLAGMDARDTWSESLEPRLHEIRTHAREAVAAFKAFSASL